MTDNPTLVPTLYAGWKNYQGLLVTALAGLTPDQLALGAAPGLRTIHDTTAHIIGARARWFHVLLGEGGDEFAALGTWDRPGQPSRSAAELVGALEATWQGMQAAITRWTTDEWAQTYPGEPPGEPASLTRQWVIWHLIEHDLHHGGEISLMLGMHGLKAPDL
jgi:uncharacterized damage-inducible protein DinB